MKTIKITGLGKFDLAEVEKPTPGKGEVRVRVHAAALNRADLSQALGNYPARPGVPADIPGLEFAGEVEARGPDADIALGTRVMGLVGGGAFAEYVVTASETLLPIPKELSWEEAAAVPEAFLTALDALISCARFKKGESVLAHAAASGVGTAALQLARELGARAVIATIRTAEKADVLKTLGATHVLVCKSANFAEETRSATGAGVDVVVDLVAGNYFAETLRSLAPRGRIVLLGLLDGSTTPLDLRQVLRNRVEIIGSVMRSRGLNERIQVAQLARERLLPLLTEKRLKPVINDVVPFSDIHRATEGMRSNQGVGKWVLRW